jgi:hypothetical protein
VNQTKKCLVPQSNYLIKTFTENFIIFLYLKYIILSNMIPGDLRKELPQFCLIRVIYGNIVVEYLAICQESLD